MMYADGTTAANVCAGSVVVGCGWYMQMALVVVMVHAGVCCTVCVLVVVVVVMVHTVGGIWLVHADDTCADFNQTTF